MDSLPNEAKFAPRDQTLKEVDELISLRTKLSGTNTDRSAIVKTVKLKLKVLYDIAATFGDSLSVDDVLIHIEKLSRVKETVQPPSVPCGGYSFQGSSTPAEHAPVGLPASMPRGAYPTSYGPSGRFAPFAVPAFVQGTSCSGRYPFSHGPSYPAMPYGRSNAVFPILPSACPAMKAESYAHSNHGQSDSGELVRLLGSSYWGSDWSP